jgi:hypothetical protein
MDFLLVPSVSEPLTACRRPVRKRSKSYSDCSSPSGIVIHWIVPRNIWPPFDCPSV